MSNNAFEEDVKITFPLSKMWNDRFNSVILKQGKIKKIILQQLTQDFIIEEETKIKALELAKKEKLGDSEEVIVKQFREFLKEKEK